MIPKDDKQYREVKIDKVEPYSDGSWSITDEEGWSFLVPASSPIAPTQGMVGRFYGRGVGATVRGLTLDGHEVFYRNEEEDRVYWNKRLYGEDAAEWLRRWDNGDSVWSIEMVGLGPGYEQAIQITTAEILRHLLDADYDADKWSNTDEWKKDREKIEQHGFACSPIKALGLSGAQWGAALILATALYKRGPLGLFTDKEIEDRKIQVRGSFPVAAAAGKAGG